MIWIPYEQTQEGERVANMRDRADFLPNGPFLYAVIAAALCFSVGLIGCNSSKPPQQPAGGPQRYHLAGRVVSVESAKQQVVVDAGDIPGFMMAMTMGYSVKNPNQLTPLSKEDQITADVVLNGNDVYLENIVVVKKADQAKSPAPSDAHPSTQPPAKQ